MIVWNGKVITKNRYIGSFVMAIAMMIFPLIPITVITLLGEVFAHYRLFGLSPGLYLSVFVEMWLGGMITLIGILVMFGRNKCGLAINQSILSLTNQEEDVV